MKARRPNTRLWHVGLIWENGDPVVLVSENPTGCSKEMRIRSITAKAAGRRYIRNNLARDIAAVDYETDNPFSPHELDDALIASRRNYERLATVRVLRKS